MDVQTLVFPERTSIYAFGAKDRIVIEDRPYRPAQDGRNEVGWLLEMDDGSGRCHQFSHEQLSRLGSRGRIRVERDHFAPEVQRRGLPDRAMIAEMPKPASARLSRRDAYVEAFRQMEAEGLIKRTDAAILANRDRLTSLAIRMMDRLIGGTATPPSQDMRNFPSPRTLRSWIKARQSFGLQGLMDGMHRRGNRFHLGSPEAIALLVRGAREYASTACPTMRTVYQKVQSSFEAENEKRAAAGHPPLPVPSYTTVRREIHKLDPYVVALEREGQEAARKKFMPVGEGLNVLYPLARVEIDENVVDVMTQMKANGILDFLTGEEKRALGLDGTKARWFVTVAIDAATRCILGIVFSRAAKEAASLKVLQMILKDKGQWRDAAARLGPWDMHGVPMTIVSDNGSAFVSEKFRRACADLGITTLRAPAGFPEMRGRIERFFQTLNVGLLNRLPGYTFGSVEKKGDADPASRAVLSFDDLAFCMVRWIVDAYHNTPHGGLGGETPLQCWRRLTARYGVQAPPDMARQRAIFGQRISRKLTREGVTVLGLKYHSTALAELLMRRESRDVEVCWHPDDIGQVTIHAGKEQFEACTVQPGFEGVSAQKWISVRRQLIEYSPERMVVDLSEIQKSFEEFDRHCAKLLGLSGLLTDEWSPDRIAREEQRLFVGFRIGETPARAPEGDRLGQRILDADPVPERMAQDVPAPDLAPETPETVEDKAATPRAPSPAPAPKARPDGAWKLTEKP